MQKCKRNVTLPLLACSSWSRGDKLLVMMCSWCFNFNHSFSPIFMDQTTRIVKSTLANRASDIYEINFLYWTTSRRDNIGCYHFRPGKWTGLIFLQFVTFSTIDSMSLHSFTWKQECKVCRADSSAWFAVRNRWPEWTEVLHLRQCRCGGFCIVGGGHTVRMRTASWCLAVPLNLASTVSAVKYGMLIRIFCRGGHRFAGTNLLDPQAKNPDEHPVFDSWNSAGQVRENH